MRGKTKKKDLSCDAYRVNMPSMLNRVLTYPLLYLHTFNSDSMDALCFYTTKIKKEEGWLTKTDKYLIIPVTLFSMGKPCVCVMS